MINDWTTSFVRAKKQLKLGSRGVVLGGKIDHPTRTIKAPKSDNKPELTIQAELIMQAELREPSRAHHAGRAQKLPSSSRLPSSEG